MIRRHVVAMAFLGIAACSTSGPESSVPEANAVGVLEQVGAAETPVEKADLDPDDMICTREKLTGTRIPTKVCLTRRERERLQEVAEDNMQAIGRTPSAVPRKE